MKEKYDRLLFNKKLENEKINVFNSFMSKFKARYSRKYTAEQAVYSEFLEQKEYAKEGIVKLIQTSRRIKKYEPEIESIDVIPEINPVDKYKFVSKIAIEKIDNDYIKRIINGVLKKGQLIDTSIITKADLKKMIKNYQADDETDPIVILKEKINDKLDNDFKVINTIVEDDMDVYEQVSSGLDAQMYFTLLSGEIRDKGIYIIDQPEDHIAPKAIKEKVLGEFRRMGQQRQIIMVTHNPQFIVNLDVDNVIYLSKENGDFEIKSGALEYEDENYSILKIVADTIEGGLQTIQGRMKRYEKSI